MANSTWIWASANFALVMMEPLPLTVATPAAMSQGAGLLSGVCQASRVLPSKRTVASEGGGTGLERSAAPGLMTLGSAAGCGAGLEAADSGHEADGEGEGGDGADTGHVGSPVCDSVAENGVELGGRHWVLGIRGEPYACGAWRERRYLHGRLR